MDNEYDDTWRRKGHIHEGRDSYPDVCPTCGGMCVDEDGEDCPECDGTGEVWD